MLGETANIRSTSLPYFQIFIILDKIPHYNSKKEITGWETFSAHNIEKYVTLSKDNTAQFMHTPNKTLLYVVYLTEDCGEVKNKKAYLNFYKKKLEIVDAPVQIKILKVL